MERLEKIKQEIQDHLNLAKVQAELRKKNEKLLKQELGVQETLTEFHKPVVKKLEEQETARRDNLHAIEEAIHSLELSPIKGTIPQIESTPIRQIDLNQGLDLTFIKDVGFELPSELVNKTDEQIDVIIQQANDRNKDVGTRKGPVVKEMNNATGNKKERLQKKIEEMNYEITMIRKYKKALNAIKTGNSYTGQGLGDHLDILEKLTQKVCEGNRSKKLHNHIVTLLDILLKDGKMNTEQVKRYYAQFLH